MRRCVRQTLEGCARAGIFHIGLWRDKVSRTGLARSAHSARRRRGGLQPLPGRCVPREDGSRTQDQPRRKRAGRRRGRLLGTVVLVLVCRPVLDLNLDAARAKVEEGVNRLASYAAQAGAGLSTEPFHPMLITGRSVIVALAQGLDVALQFDPMRVGVIADVYHVWWDPDTYRQISRTSGPTFGFHVND